jgi:hypothetical protein
MYRAPTARRGRQRVSVLAIHGSRILNRGAKLWCFACGRIRAPWRATLVKKRRTLGVLAVAIAVGLAGGVFVSKMAAEDDDHHSLHFRFEEGSLVLSRSVYVGAPGTITVGQTLPPGCVAGTITLPLLAGGTTTVKIKAGSSSGCNTAGLIRRYSIMMGLTGALGLVRRFSWTT